MLCEFAIGTVNFDIPFERILALTAIEDCGLKSPSTSEIAGVSAKESQIKKDTYFPHQKILIWSLVQTQPTEA